MSFSEIFLEASSSLSKEQLEEIYNNIDNPYNDMPKRIGGVEYSKLKDINVDPGTMFYAINSNGKRVTSRSGSLGFRAKRVKIGDEEYIVTNLLKYPGKKWIKEIMISKA